MEMKHCHKCGQTKPITDFYPNNRGGCKKCVRAYQKKYYEDHYAPEKKTDPEGFRTCSICHELKPVTYFYRDKSNVSGYSHRCKGCGDVLREARRQKEREAKEALKEIVPEGFKRCSKCKALLPLSEFKRTKKKNGEIKYYSPCRKCLNLYLQQNKEKIREQNRAYMQRPEVKEKARIRIRKWAKDNSDYQAKQKAYRVEYNQRAEVKAKNKAHNANYRSRPESQEKARQRTIEWRKANPEKASYQSKIKNYRRKTAEGHFDYDQWITLLTFYRGYCPCCGKKRVLTVDHIIPITWGGSNWIGNLQALCGRCNTAKGNHHSTDYRPPAAKAWADSEMAKMNRPTRGNSPASQVEQLRFDFI